MGVDEHGGGAVWNDGAGELGDRHHAAFDMHVAVAQARHQVAAGSVDNFSLHADGMGGVGAYIGKAAGGDGDVSCSDHLARMDIDPAALADHQVCGGPALGRVDQGRGAFGPAFHRGHPFSTSRASSSKACDPAVMTLPPQAGSPPVHSAATPPAPVTMGSKGAMS